MTYWDARFQGEGRIWGAQPSRTVNLAIDLFVKHRVCMILVPGSGYGRYIEAFAAKGFRVTGLDLSITACRMAKSSADRAGLKIEYTRGNVLNMPYRDARFEGVYCFNTLHFFLYRDRARFIEEVHRVLAPPGVAFFTVFSERDPAFGRGEEVEPRTFVSKADRPAYYFTEHEVDRLFMNFNVRQNQVITEPEAHGGRVHTHVLRLIVATKM